MGSKTNEELRRHVIELRQKLKEAEAEIAKVNSLRLVDDGDLVFTVESGDARDGVRVSYSDWEGDDSGTFFFTQEQTNQLAQFLVEWGFGDGKES